MIEPTDPRDPVVIKTVSDPFDADAGLGFVPSSPVRGETNTDNVREAYMLLVPENTVLPQAKIEVHLLNDLIDVGTAHTNGAFVVAFSNYRVLDLVLQHASLFRTKFAVLAGVPNVVYDERFLALTSRLTRYSWNDLVADQAKQRAAKLLEADTSNVVEEHPLDDGSDAT